MEKILSQIHHMLFDNFSEIKTFQEFSSVIKQLLDLMIKRSFIKNYPLNLNIANRMYAIKDEFQNASFSKEPFPKEEIFKFLFEHRGSELVLETNRYSWGDIRFMDGLEPSLNSDGWDGIGGADGSLSAKWYGKAKLEPTQAEHKPLETITQQVGW